jgi:cytochrome P450 family 710 subfamily A protein
MADAMIDFLFASQDASTASLVWCLTLMADHPDMLQRVREEQLRLRPDPSHQISAEVLGEMTYTRQVRCCGGGRARVVGVVGTAGGA